ncbi:hypothetical protein [Streptomyces sp. SID10815]|uniref:hypothetical protein n=1 Tax=Streptomyces sp. SID10815 TaxID=2706027 RepID=UPI0013CB7674|nr:hypothetical protein [Streptomyces sp. SID10815]NEA46835.1 hypothetical protein [Streptomyces sp. SID10815]
MTSDPELLWRRCARLGRVLLPLVDDGEPWRRARRHENFRVWEVDTGTGERLIEVFTALAAHAVAADAAAPAAEIDGLPLRAVADAATRKRDFELLAGLPGTFTDRRDEEAVNFFRLSAYGGGQASRRLFQLSTEIHHALTVLAERSPRPCATCGDVFRQATEAGLP